jgi:hypothetical protein
MDSLMAGQKSVTSCASVFWHEGVVWVTRTRRPAKNTKREARAGNALCNDPLRVLRASWFRSHFVPPRRKYDTNVDF